MAKYNNMVNEQTVVDLVKQLHRFGSHETKTDRTYT